METPPAPSPVAAPKKGSSLLAAAMAQANAAPPDLPPAPGAEDDDDYEDLPDLDAPPPPPQVDDVNVEEMDVTDLREKLASMGLDSSGTKSKLRARLLEATGQGGDELLPPPPEDDGDELMDVGTNVELTLMDEQIPARITAVDASRETPYLLKYTNTEDPEEWVSLDEDTGQFRDQEGNSGPWNIVINTDPVADLTNGAPPAGLPPPPGQPAPPPSGDWEEYADPDTGRAYYYNQSNGSVVWEKPADFGQPKAPKKKKKKKKRGQPKSSGANSDDDMNVDQSAANSGEEIKPGLTRVKMLIDQYRGLKGTVDRYMEKKGKYGIKLDNGKKCLVADTSFVLLSAEAEKLMDLTANTDEDMLDLTTGEFDVDRKLNEWGKPKQTGYRDNYEMAPVKEKEFDMEDWEQEKRGVVRKWIDERGFGFIRPENKKFADIFFHIRNCTDENRRPAENDKVIFKYQMGRKEKPEACEVDIVYEMQPEEKQKVAAEQAEATRIANIRYRLGQAVDVAVDLGKYQTVKVTKVNEDGSYQVTFPPSAGGNVWEGVQSDELRETNVGGVPVAVGMGMGMGMPAPPPGAPPQGMPFQPAPPSLNPNDLGGVKVQGKLLVGGEGGAGVEFKYDARGWWVAEVKEDGPGQPVLRAGDLIVAINANVLTGLSDEKQKDVMRSNFKNGAMLEIRRGLVMP